MPRLPLKPILPNEFGGTDAPFLPTAEMSRHNGLLYVVSMCIFMFAAPVVYVGVVQAGLLDKLGASAMVANLPASTYLLGAFAPPLLSWLVPHRFVRTTAVVACAVTTTMISVVCICLFAPVSDMVRLIAVIGQGLIQGFSAYTFQVYKYQCLKRGTTPEGRAWAFKWTFALGPIFAVAGSLWAQYILGGGIEWLPYPYDFALLYLIGAPCMGMACYLTSRYDLARVPETPRQPFVQYYADSFRSFVRQPTLVYLWLAFFMWFMVFTAMPTLSLYSREVLGGDPKDYSGWVMALRFGFKAVAGYALGVIALRYGLRSPLFVCMVLLGTSIIWGWAVPGYFYLLAFGLMGAGELGGAYFPNYIVGISSPALSTMNMSILMMTSCASFFAPTTHGALADHFGFHASFIFALVAAVVSLFLIAKLPKLRAQDEATGSPSGEG